MEIEQIIKEVTEYKGILLYEERGVGATGDYLSVIKDITDYVASYIKYNSPGYGGEWHVNIPDSLTKKLDMFSKLDLTVTVEDLGYDAHDRSGAGETNSFRFPQQLIEPRDKEDKNSPLQYSRSIPIHIHAYSNGNKLARHTLAGNLVHELNHKWDEYSRVKNNPEDSPRFDTKRVTSVFDQSVAYNRLQGMFTKGTKDPVYYLIYRLFSESELNALIASTYGYLESMDSKRKNFAEDIKHIQPYWVYSKTKNTRDNILPELDNNYWQSLKEFFEAYPILSPLPKVKEATVPQFKRAFLNKVDRCLNKLMKGIGRVASYYYDMHEDSKTEEPTHTNNSKLDSKIDYWGEEDDDNLLESYNSLIQAGCPLTEERGVAASQDIISLVKELIEYIRSTVKESPSIDKFNIPEDIVSKFPKEYDLKSIKVKVEHLKKYDYASWGGSQVETSFGGKNAEMEILVLESDGDILEKQLAGNLIHELNHLIEIVHRRDNESMTGYVDQVIASNSFDGGTQLGRIIYRLFEDTEIDALIASVYGELDALKSKRENFKQDIQKTQAMSMYRYLSKVFNNLQDVPPYILYNNVYLQSSDKLRKLFPYPNRDVSKVTAGQFKNAFLKKVSFRLARLFKGIGRVASYYYDTVEGPVAEKRFTIK